MRMDPHYITNLATSLDQVQANTQQLTSQLTSGVRVNSLSDDPLAAGQNVLLLNQIQQDDSVYAKLHLGDGQASGGRLGPGKRGFSASRRPFPSPQAPTTAQIIPVM